MQRILSLDDDIEILDLLHAVLKRAKYDHVCTTDSHEALHLLRTEPFDLLTQDLLRPDIDGYELYQILRQDARLKHLPIVLITAQSPITLSHHCQAMLAEVYPDAYLGLPFSPQQLLTVIKNALNTSHAA